MIPTIKKGNTQYDYNPLDSTTYDFGLTQDYNQSSDGHNSRLIMALTPSESGNLRQNHGQMYPPYPEDGMTFN